MPGVRVVSVDTRPQCLARLSSVDAMYSTLNASAPTRHRLHIFDPPRSRSFYTMVPKLLTPEVAVVSVGQGNLAAAMLEALPKEGVTMPVVVAEVTGGESTGK
eukprot:Hpha_TRINITY_DN32249_c0_g1::TRINITY_DN32249_c0_g1_i1::g.155197::m.155197